METEFSGKSTLKEREPQNLPLPEAKANLWANKSAPGLKPWAEKSGRPVSIFSPWLQPWAGRRKHDALFQFSARGFSPGRFAR